MNVKKLLSVCILLAGFSVVKATTWIPIKAEFDKNNHYFLYNVGAKKFLNIGSGDASQAVASDIGLDIFIRDFTDTWGISYNVYSVGKFDFCRDERKMGEGAVVLWNSGNHNERKWKFALVSGEENVYTIQVPETDDLYQEGEYFGLNPDKKDNPNGFYFDTNYEKYKENCHWYFVAVDDGNRYLAAQKLLAEIKDAEGYGATSEQVSKAQAVYDDINSTQQALDGAISEMRALKVRLQQSKATLDSPVDITKMVGIADYKDLPHNMYTDWTNEMIKSGTRDLVVDDKVNYTGPKLLPENLNLPMIDIYSDGEFKGSFYKTYTGLPQGFYTFKLQAVVYDKDLAGGHEGLYVFANDERVAVNESNAIAEYYEVTTWVGEDGTLKVGVEQPEDGDYTQLFISDPQLYYSRAAYNATVTSAGYGTLCLPFDADVPSGVEAYSITGTNGNSLEVSQVNEIKANQPVLLKNSGEYLFEAKGTPSSLMTGSESLTSGCLVGTYIKTDVPVNSYVLQNQSEYGVAFYRVGTEQPKITPFHAYISKQTANANIKALLLPGSDVTGIIENVAEDVLVDVYRLDGTCVRHSVKNGQALEGLQRGIYIVNGEKKCVE